MTLKKFFSYFILPIIAILLIPYFTQGEVIDEVRLIMAVTAGIFLGGIRCLWDVYQHRKQKIDY